MFVGPNSPSPPQGRGGNNSPAGNSIRELNQLVRRLERSGQQSQRTRVATGCRPLDQLLPGQGLVRGSLAEWLGDGSGSGASMLALVAAREACREGGLLVVVDRGGTFYPPAAAAWRIDLQSTIVVRPKNDKDEHWTLDQALRCEHVAAVVGWPRQLDSFTFRRLQLAAEASGSLGLFVRSAASKTEPSWADVRLCVSPRPTPLSSPPSTHWRLRVQLLRCRGRFGESEIELEINDRTGEIHETHPRDLAPQLAHPATGEHPA